MKYFTSIFHEEVIQEVKGEAEADYKRREVAERLSRSHGQINSKTASSFLKSDSRKPMKNASDYHTRRGYAEAEKDTFHKALTANDTVRHIKKEGLDRPKHESTLLDFDVL